MALQDLYIIGTENFQNWSPGYNKSGYLKVLPHPSEKVVFKNPFSDWQRGNQNGQFTSTNTTGTYYSSWGPDKDLDVTLDMRHLSQINIDGFGILKAGDGFIPWLKDQTGSEKTTAYEFLRAYNGLIPGPLLVADPGDTIKITLKNHLEPSSVAPSAPEEDTNLHTHGLHVSPLGPGDNVLVSVAAGDTREISIKIPDNHFLGLDWYHPHIHGMTSQQVASGLGGLLAINPAYNLPDLNKFNPTTEPFYTMAINTFGIQQQLRTPNPNDPLNKSGDRLEVPAGTPLQLTDGSYTLSDAVFAGYNAKPLNYDPTKPTGNPDPANRSSEYGGGGLAEPVENVIHTVNGQYNPTIESVQTGKWSLFSFANMSVNSFFVIQLIYDDGNGNLTPETVNLVSLDGDASGVVEGTRREITNLPVLAPGQRVSIQHAFTKPGKYYFLANGTNEVLDPKYVSEQIGEKGFSDGHLIWAPQVLATVDVTGSAIAPGELPPFPQAYDVLVQESQEISATIQAAKNGDVDRQRTFVWDANIGGAIQAGNSPSDTKVETFEGTYTINGKYYSTDPAKGMPPLTIPMLGTKEIWTIVNKSGLPNPDFNGQTIPGTPIPLPNIPLPEWHPFHIHQNDFTVLEINGLKVEDINQTYLAGVLADTINLPPAYIDGTVTPDNPYGTPFNSFIPGTVGKASEVKILMSFEDFPGSYVNHCHILFHEDAGMMTVIRVVLNTQDTWLGLGVDQNADGQIELFRANNYQQGITLTPYGQNFSQGIDVAIADVNYKFKHDNKNQNVTDNVTDIITIQRSLEKASEKFTVKVFDGETLIQKQKAGAKEVKNSENAALLITEINPFQDITPTTDQEASVASGDIDGDGFADIVVGLGGGIVPIIEIYSGKDYHLMSRIAPFHHETFTGKINLAVGDINGDNYDDIIVGQGSGGHGLVEVYNGILISEKGTLVARYTAHTTVLLSKKFQPYGPNYTGEVDVTSGYILQRPDQPNGSPTQTNNANLTTIAKSGKPDGYEQIQVFTYTGKSGSHSHNTTSQSSDPEDELRLDVSLTPIGNTQEILGTFADLPGLSKGEPVMFTRQSSGEYNIVHMGSGNTPESVTFGKPSVPEINQDNNSDIFTLNGGSNGKVKLKVTLEQSSSSLVNELAVFVVDGDDGNIGGIAPGASGYTDAALGRAKVLFSAISNLPSGFNISDAVSLLEFDSGAKVRFLLVNNSTLDSVSSGFTPKTEILFSDTSQNIESLTGGKFSLKWKDKSGDSNFKVKVDVSTETTIKGTSFQGSSVGEVLDFRSATTDVQAEFKVYREAAFNNFVGFYPILDEQGKIDTNKDGKADFAPGDAGYLQAAINLYLKDIRLSVSNQGEATYQGTFAKGSLFVPFIIANGTPEAVLSGSSSNIPAVYFPFLRANSDQADHIRLLGNNLFGFEDLPTGSSDKDYNDIIVKINLG